MCVEDCATKNADVAPAQQTENDDSNSLYSFAWVRTAAQAAMALKVHGMLETTGLPSVSAKLQHAALPDFGPLARKSEWDDRSLEQGKASPPEVTSTLEGSNFEDGVVDDDGYDLLPLPVPAPERRILTVGIRESGCTGEGEPAGPQGKERFHYGMGALDSREKCLESDDPGAYLADIAVEQNIDKLREVIGSVDNTLNRCHLSVARIRSAHKQRLQLHLGFLRGIDSWPEMRGRFVSQRSLMKGVAGIDHSREVYDESDEALINGKFVFSFPPLCSLYRTSTDLSWQAKIASCAVVAAEDVRAAVRAAKTAANARAAASAAALAAEMACEKNKFAHFDEMRALQTRASLAQSHAIHAAVVEHEAKTVKRRSTMALAHDVKTWNIHRKRETLLSCIAFARGQHEAARRSVDAWSSLCTGFVGTPVNPPIGERRNQPKVSEPIHDEHPIIEPGEVITTMYTQPMTTSGLFSQEAEKTGSCSGETTTDLLSHTDVAVGDFTFPFVQAELVSQEKELASSEAAASLGTGLKTMAQARSSTKHTAKSDGTENLSASMQSLVDGLMSWGGGFDVEEDLALPAGMAASIALEGNLGIL